MPHQFKAHPGHPAVDYLVRLHAGLGGRRAISARRKQATNPWFKRGTLFRAALDVLRTATAPLTVTQLTYAVLESHGIADATRKQRLGIESGRSAGFGAGQ
jgi:hypothetical protein